MVSSAPVASVGPLVPADELLVHQIADTFATVGQSDRSWTEKIWAMATDRQGSIQAAFGLGVYPNRGVVDAFGHVSVRHDKRPDRFLLARNMAPGHVTAEDIVEFTLIPGTGPPKHPVSIAARASSRIMGARRDIPE